jgi:hypothetical protein
MHTTLITMKTKIELLLLGALLFFTACGGSNLDESDAHRKVIDQYTAWFLSPGTSNTAVQFIERTPEASTYLVNLTATNDNLDATYSFRFELKDMTDGWLLLALGEMPDGIPSNVVMREGKEKQLFVVIDESDFPLFNNNSDPVDGGQ